LLPWNIQEIESEVGVGSRELESRLTRNLTRGNIGRGCSTGWQEIEISRAKEKTIGRRRQCHYLCGDWSGKAGEPRQQRMLAHLAD